jgi:hypothetical protein
VTAVRAAPLVLALVACGDAAPPADDAPPADAFTAVTFNTGTTEGLAGVDTDAGGWTAGKGAISDAWYGDGLAWPRGIEAARAWLAATAPDVVVFEEIFDVATCPDVPVEDRVGFVCEGWTEGDPTVPERVLGEGWQVGCFPGHADKCLAVRRAFGTLHGCGGDRCDDALDGFQVDGCGKGARVARARVDRADGTVLTVVGIHGSSGITADDQACRVAQLDQAFVDLGDGAPGADGEANLVLGDFNTDPVRLVGIDASAARLAELVVPPLAFVDDVDGPPTYGGLVSIDHQVSDAFAGDCVTPGVTPGTEPVLDVTFFDHHPTACTLRPR